MSEDKAILGMVGLIVGGIVVLAAVILAGVVLLDRTELCRDAILRPEAWTGLPTIECPRAEQTVVRDGDTWRCMCPNAPKEVETP